MRHHKMLTRQRLSFDLNVNYLNFECFSFVLPY